MTTIFTRSYEGRSTEVKVIDDITWWEMSEEFFAFLQGCGYQVTREDFAEYWMQYMKIENTTGEDK
jgi:hypothetical protein